MSRSRRSYSDARFDAPGVLATCLVAAAQRQRVLVLHTPLRTAAGEGFGTPHTSGAPTPAAAAGLRVLPSRFKPAISDSTASRIDLREKRPHNFVRRARSLM